MSVRMASVAARLGLATLGMAVALAAIGQPSAAQDSKPAGASDAASKVDKGRELFGTFGCGSCHSLADAGATGHVGPSFDGDSNLTEAFIVNRVTNGQGAMPSFSDQLSPDEIAALATYLTKVAAK